jgi:predicted permease
MMRPSHWPYRLRLRLRSLFLRREIERDLDDEFAFHLAMQAEANRQAGMREDEACAEAARQFGGATQVREACRDRIFGCLERFGQDVRYAVRSVGRSPAFSAFVVLSLAFGIGVNVSIFALVNAVLLRPLPLPDPDRLAVIDGAYSIPRFEYYSRDTRAFSGVAAWLTEAVTVVGTGGPNQAQGARVSAGFFPVLGVKPLAGRFFLPDEDQRGGPLVVVLSYSAWQRYFNSDPSLVGKAIRLNAESATVIGILPQTFRYPGQPVDFWQPRVFDVHWVSQESVRRGAGILNDIIVRLRPGVSLRAADAGLQVLDAAYRNTYPENGDIVWHVNVKGLQQSVVSDVRSSLLLLWGAAGCVLLITCANTASLLLARATARHKEIAVRLALGVSRGRLVQQLLIENMPFVFCGGLLGMGLARVAITALSALSRETLARQPVMLDGTAIVFAIGVTVFSGLMFGLAPAIQSIRSDPNDGLRATSRGVSARGQVRLRGSLVVAETAMALALTMSASVLLRSYVHMRTLRTGIQTDHVLTAALRIPVARYGTDQQKAAFFDELLRRVGNLPGVTAAGVTSYLHLESRGEGSKTQPEGYPDIGPASPIVKNRTVSPDYFRALGIPRSNGRSFTSADTATSPRVMIVNESFAGKYFPDGRILGRHVTYSMNRVNCEIVGVVADVRRDMGAAGAEPEMYLPFTQHPRETMTLVVRSALDPSSIAAATGREVRAIDPDQPIYQVGTFDDVLSTVLTRPRSITSIVGFFSVAALVLAAVGIYGVLSYSVAQRRREMSIRMALGAEPRQIRILVLAHSLRLVGAGVVIGVPSALALGGLSSSLLFGIKAADPTTMAAAVLLILLVGVAAAYLPARRAARVDPMRALQSE